MRRYFHSGVFQVWESGTSLPWKHHSLMLCICCHFYEHEILNPFQTSGILTWNLHFLVAESRTIHFSAFHFSNKVLPRSCKDALKSHTILSLVDFYCVFAHSWLWTPKTHGKKVKWFASCDINRYVYISPFHFSKKNSKKGSNSKQKDPFCFSQSCSLFEVLTPSFTDIVSDCWDENFGW